ncbi:hypothetical protein [Amycolatopsis echigonensis]|uniref:Uncharacterized protein n=1 Tax=Amycolatopsis echigonensis TaxID=2576905 RepID=A0A2N3X231_9PSEU|nr:MULTISPECIES: hypothetical protein [Amycolatopsis]MBB2500475.1 hypothetical protein [Amycolatopsis echigonensis]PKW00166.1 hypothetical protein ATK30_0252 [Amycolatopsis niigatensis]
MTPIADDLVLATRTGDLDEVVRLLGELDSLPVRLRVLRGLVHRCAAAVTDRFGPQPEDAVFTAVAVDEHAGAADVDDLPPAVRAALRAVLAELNGDFEALEVQLSLAVREPRLTGVVHCLLWAAGLPGFSAR